MQAQGPCLTPPLMSENLNIESTENIEWVSVQSAFCELCSFILFYFPLQVSAQSYFDDVYFIHCMSVVYVLGPNLPISFSNMIHYLKINMMQNVSVILKSGMNFYFQFFCGFSL